MLGKLNTEKKWEWCASGKHPASRDYFKISGQQPLMKAFVEWTGKGYDQLKKRPEFGRTLYSWRFWSKGALPDTLVCGIIRDSGDTLGRPYPLLIMGTGSVARWQSHPELLPFALEETWKQMESIAAGRFANLPALKEAIRCLLPPAANWRSTASRYLEKSADQRSGTRAPDPDRDIKQLVPGEKGVSQPQHLFFEITAAASERPLELAMAWGLQLKKQAQGLPSTFLMGGIPEKAYLAFFFRPLSIQDFIRLWSIASPLATVSDSVL